MLKIGVIVLLLISSAGAQMKILTLSESDPDHGAGFAAATNVFYPDLPDQVLADNGTLSSRSIGTARSTRKLTGILSQDLFSAQQDTLSHKDSLDVLETRSSIKAGFFSLLIPGTGQAYNGGTGNYIKAAGFLALEAAAIAVNIIWTNKGNNQTTAFQNFANANYSVVRYVQWIQLNYQGFEQNGMNVNLDNQTQPPVPVSDPATLNKYITNYEIWLNHVGPDPTKAPWTQVNWYALNAVETALGGYFSHNLAAYGTQDYYEIIGKYPQFREGWNPKAATDNADISLNQLLNDVELNEDTYYMTQRHIANNFYGVSGTALGVLIANHFLSAIEAAVWAHGHNKLVHTTIGVSQLPGGFGYQTQVNVAVNF